MALVERLASPLAQEVESAIVDAYLTFDQSQQRAALRQPRPEGGESDPDVIWWRQEEARIRHAFETLLPQGLLGLSLSDEEADALTSALLSLLGTERYAAGAARALGASSRLAVVPNLIRTASMYCERDATIAINAAIAIRRTLMVAKDSELHSPEARQIFADAISCLEHIIQAGKVEPGLDSREQAMAEKATLIRRFGGRMAVQGGG